VQRKSASEKWTEFAKFFASGPDLRRKSLLMLGLMKNSPAENFSLK